MNRGHQNNTRVNYNKIREYYFHKRLGALMTTKNPPILTRRVRQFPNKPRIARLATQGVDDYPHVVPIWFRRDGDDIVFGSDRDNRKVRNILANPKGAVVIGGELPIEEEGYMIQGDLSIEEDPKHASMWKMLLRYVTKKDAERLAKEWADSDLIVIRLRPRKVIRVY
jgi:nitroimidazol reductase NimA-like FMN-containing flavoprotein (pyridoxamine 5'-phosphate oxidase superfamily)